MNWRNVIGARHEDAVQLMKESDDYLELTVKRDDDIVSYENGKEVSRSNRRVCACSLLSTFRPLSPQSKQMVKRQALH